MFDYGFPWGFVVVIPVFFRHKYPMYTQCMRLKLYLKVCKVKILLYPIREMGRERAITRQSKNFVVIQLMEANVHSELFISTTLIGTALRSPTYKYNTHRITHCPALMMPQTESSIMHLNCGLPRTKRIYVLIFYEVEGKGEESAWFLTFSYIDQCSTSRADDQRDHLRDAANVPNRYSQRPPET
jgi:hypothetical protein